MNVDTINSHLLSSESPELVLPHMLDYIASPFKFESDFGLTSLPEEEGVILIRGPRQYGKSTWLEKKVVETIKKFGPGSCTYLNGDKLRDSEDLLKQLRILLSAFSPACQVKRIFIDEITAVDNWERAIKILADERALRGILLITTGSKASDLRRGSERLPGRKGRLTRTNYLFLPIPFREFKRVCAKAIPNDRLLKSYMLSGGSPIACAELAKNARIPEYVVMIIRDWIFGECSRADKSRSYLVAIIDQLHRGGGTPIGYSKLARDSGLANNTVASTYIELLQDLLVVGACLVWDTKKHVMLRRKQCKFHFINLLSALAFSATPLHSTNDFDALSPEEQSKWLEWLVAQELYRRRAIKGEEFPELLGFWQGKHSEIDFVDTGHEFIEVKRGQASPFEFSEFLEEVPKARLKVICKNKIRTMNIQSLSIEDFLLEE